MFVTVELLRRYTSLLKNWIVNTIQTPTRVSQLINDSNFYVKPANGIPESDLANGIGSDIVVVQNTQPTSANTKIWLQETAEIPVQVPTVSEVETALAGKISDVVLSNGTSIVNNGVATIPYAQGSSNGGIVKLGNVSQYGISTDTSGYLDIIPASVTDIKEEDPVHQPITPVNLSDAVFYGLAAAAGDTTQKASRASITGQYTDEAKIAIKEMLGVTYTLTVMAQTHDNVTVSGQVVTVQENNSNGRIYATANYNRQPVSFSLPQGFQYYVTITDNLAEHFSPTTATGIIENNNTIVTLEYSDITDIHTASDIKNALNLGVDLSLLVGEQIECGVNTEAGQDVLIWDVVDYDEIEENVTLMLHSIPVVNGVSLYTARAFDPPQALMKYDNGLAAGKYYFQVENTYYLFELSEQVPPHGSLGLVKNGTQLKVISYFANNRSMIIETVSTVIANSVPSAYTFLGACGVHLNDFDRCLYGSNNFGESQLFDWLNKDQQFVFSGPTKFSAATAPTSPAPSPSPDSPPLPDSLSEIAGYGGFLSGIDKTFINCLDNTEWTCYTNETYECPESLGGITEGADGLSYTVQGKFAIPLSAQLINDTIIENISEVPFDLFSDISAGDDASIKYCNGTAVQYWTRFPFESTQCYTMNEYGENTTVASYEAYVFPICKISKDSSTEEND